MKILRKSLRYYISILWKFFVELINYFIELKRPGFIDPTYQGTFWWDCWPMARARPWQTAVSQTLWRRSKIFRYIFSSMINQQTLGLSAAFDIFVSKKTFSSWPFCNQNKNFAREMELFLSFISFLSEKFRFLSVWGGLRAEGEGE